MALARHADLLMNTPHVTMEEPCSPSVNEGFPVRYGPERLDLFDCAPRRSRERSQR
jgi:hypothetical protein